MPSRGFQRVYQAGTRDLNGRFMGGTEIMHLAAHAGRLYAATSTMWDQPGEDPAVGAQVLVLDRPGGAWRVEHEFEARNWRMSIVSLTFTGDRHGRMLKAPVPLLLAAPSDGQGHATVHSRDESSGTWTRMVLATQSPRTASVRSLSLHRDTVTGIEHVFAGTLPGGLFRGGYDAAVPGSIHWDEAPELADYKARPMAFAVCNGALHVAIKPHLYRRVDGEAPRWEKVYTLPEDVTRISSGLRGLTTVPHPSGQGECLLAALEGNRARIIRIDPRENYRETIDLDILQFLETQWGRRPGYAIAAYDDMTPVKLPGKDGTALLIGLEATHSTQHETHPKDGWEPGGRYLIRHPDPHYVLRQIIDPSLDPMPPLVSTRTIRVSPFNPETLYFGGYDPNSLPAHNTGWVFSAPLDVALGA
ncbi:hypothetical protein POL68_22975 [Stigmatella sp. ncwal1]|uniref:Uncharacterized protein n=1 Tax=Stigmatella ashevillensis TaxID=2995309 RepID=A0ABT5DCF0_9BACT|nr:hypothetical protein [Stigmatella ashevillena]MDC0711352.1 hypothetical protein [Stigmatella ashevillena]